MGTARLDMAAVSRTIRELNMLRFFHYSAMFGWGFVRPEPGYPFRLDLATLTDVPLVTASIFALMFFIARLERKSLGQNTPAKELLLSAGLALVFAFIAGLGYGLIISGVLTIFYLHHAPPVALVRIRLLSRMVLATNSLLLILAGYLIRRQSPWNFDPWIVVVIMVGAAAFGMVELVLGKKRPHSHRGKALVAGHLASLAVMLLYQLIH